MNDGKFRLILEVAIALAVIYFFFKELQSGALTSAGSGATVGAGGNVPTTSGCAGCGGGCGGCGGCRGASGASAATAVTPPSAPSPGSFAAPLPAASAPQQTSRVTSYEAQI